MAPKCRSMRGSGLASASGKSDLQMLHGLRFEHPKITVVLLPEYKQSYINETHDLREIIDDIPLDYSIISKAKLGDNFPNVQITMSNYEIRTRRDRDR